VTSTKPRHRWEENTRIKIDLVEIGRGGMEWINLAQYIGQWRVLVKTLMHLRVP
jgi:hypothetical protein